MRTKKYYFNKQTLRYEEYKVSVAEKVMRVIGILSAVVITGIALAVLIDTYLPSQKEQALMREINEMRYQYAHVQQELSTMSKELERIQERDAQVHRFVFGMDPIDEQVWSAGIGGTDVYGDLGNFPHAGETMAEARKTIDRISRQLEIQSRSLDTIETRAVARAERLKSIPSIKPVRVDLLARNVTLLSGFGMRDHPIHKVRKMHLGLDFTAPEGTAIQATGNGTVIAVKESQSGYGRHVIVDHGYDYTTLYGHMDEIYVDVGDSVEKGQQIGTVGNTGTSTAPHCHYEVRHKGKAVDPIHYCLDGLTPEQYSELVKRASASNQSFD